MAELRCHLDGPGFDADGSRADSGLRTVFFNGVLVENHFELKGETFFIGKPVYKEYDTAPIKLQAHGDPSDPIQLSKYLGQRTEIGSAVAISEATRYITSLPMRRNIVANCGGGRGRRRARSSGSSCAAGRPRPDRRPRLRHRRYRNIIVLMDGAILSR